MQLTIDSEFKSVIPAQTAEECAALEASLLAEGCRDALVVWQGKNILIDGHHRYDICTRHNIPFKTVGREFASREDVIIWMVDNQLARRNLELFQRAELALRKEDAISLLAKQNMSLGGQGLLNSTTLKTVHTRKEVATDANTSEDTVRKVKAIKKTAPEVVKKQARSGELTVNRAFEITKALQPIPAEFHDVIATNALDNLERVQTMARLYKSAGSMETNGTFYEIIKTGGFFYGDDMDKWCDFWKDSNRAIDRALQSVSKNHRIMATQKRIQDFVDAGANEPTPDPITIIHGDMLQVLLNHETRYNLIIADPPYNVTGLEWDKIGTNEQFIRESRRWLEACISVASAEYHLFWFCSPRYAADIEMIFRELELPIRSRVVWHRRNMSMGSDSKMGFIDSWEMILHTGTYPLNYADDWTDARFDVQTFAVPQSNFTDQKLHPTQKPLDLIKHLITFGSYPGQNILDPFAGSGTTGHASLQVGNRACTLIEKSREYVDVIKSRTSTIKL